MCASWWLFLYVWLSTAFLYLFLGLYVSISAFIHIVESAFSYVDMCTIFWWLFLSVHSFLCTCVCPQLFCICSWAYTFLSVHLFTLWICFFLCRNVYNILMTFSVCPQFFCTCVCSLPFFLRPCSYCRISFYCSRYLSLFPFYLRPHSHCRISFYCSRYLSLFLSVYLSIQRAGGRSWPYLSSNKVATLAVVVLVSKVGYTTSRRSAFWHTTSRLNNIALNDVLS